ncbi:hypothetical protein L7F22_065280 [Adiantum nelumboides]|nr:hypothetical protein [Adiantum nelumboides]
MLGVAGMLIPDLLTKIDIINVPAWYDAGKVYYFVLASTLFVIEFILFHYVEVRRWQDIKYPGSVNADPFNPRLTLPPSEVGYLGGIFNPLNFPTSMEIQGDAKWLDQVLKMMRFSKIWIFQVGARESKWHGVSRKQQGSCGYWSFKRLPLGASPNK